MMRLIALVAVLMTLPISSAAAGWEESPAIADLFKSRGVNGTFVIYDAGADTYIGHDKVRAERRYTPASTFKIPNSLIGLAAGAVKSVDEIIPYKGDPQPFIREWARNMGLREAIGLSNVPIYQELARRIGLERMREFVSKLDYGNRETGNVVDVFWLNGTLKISAVEQARFLARLARTELPFPRNFQKDVCDIIFLDQGKNWKLHGKTGWQNAPGEGLGWWVGWVEKEGRIYAFALNMDIQKPSDAAKRVPLGKACLKALMII
jgi:beta-lactamase class D